MADLEPQLGLEHLGGVIHVHVGPGHVLQRVVCDGETLSQVQAQCLPPVGEDVKCNLGKTRRRFLGSILPTKYSKRAESRSDSFLLNT